MINPVRNCCLRNICSASQVLTCSCLLYCPSGAYETIITQNNFGGLYVVYNWWIFVDGERNITRVINKFEIRQNCSLMRSKDTNEDSNKIKEYCGDSIRYPALIESDIDIAAPMKYYTWDIKAVQMNIISFRGDRWLLWMCLYNGGLDQKTDRDK